MQLQMLQERYVYTLCFVDAGFIELQEDDPVAKRFPEYLVIPHTLTTLTTENYTSFIDQNKGCLIAFYLPCEWQEHNAVHW